MSSIAQVSDTMQTILTSRAKELERESGFVERSSAQTSDEVDVDVFVGKWERLPVRLIAVRVSAEEARRRREGANGRITHPPKGCQAPVPGNSNPRMRKAVVGCSRDKCGSNVRS